MDDLRRQIAAQEAAAKKTRYAGSQQYLQFYQAPIGSTTSLRFLPARDGGLPWVTRYQTSLHFDGIVNSEYDSTERAVVRIPCLQTWAKPDPIQKAIAPFWKESEEIKNERARPYWRREQYVLGCFAVSLPYAEKETPASPVRLVALSKTLFNALKTGLSDVDFEFAPIDYDHGREFKIAKTQQGAWAAYSGSFGYKERPLSDVELAAIEQHGLPDLTAELGTEPDAATVALMFEMYEASVRGEPFDARRWGQFKAWSASGDSGGSPRSTPSNGSTAPSDAPASTMASDAPTGAPGTTTGTMTAIEMVAALRARQRVTRTPTPASASTEV